MSESLNNSIDSPRPRLKITQNTKEQLKLGLTIQKMESAIQNQKKQIEQKTYFQERAKFVLHICIDIYNQEYNETLDAKSDTGINSFINALLRKGYYFFPEARSESNDYYIHKIVDSPEVDIGSFPGVSSLTNEKGKIEFLVIDTPHSRYVGSYSNTLGIIVINMYKLREAFSVFQQSIPSTWNQSVTIQEYYNWTVENEIWHHIYRNKLQQDIRDIDIIEDRDLTIKGIQPSFRQANEFISDTVNIKTNPIAIVRVLATLINMVKPQSNGIAFNGELPKSYHHTMLFLLQELEKYGPLQKLITPQLIKERDEIFRIPRKTQADKERAARLISKLLKGILEEIGEKELGNIAQNFTLHGEKIFKKITEKQ